MINDDFVKYENSKNDEYIRLYTTIIGIDNLISKASSAEEANALFKAKDVIYSQQKHFIYRQPDNGWISVDDRLPEIKEHYCSELVMCYSPDGELEYLFDYYEMNVFGQGCFTTEKHSGITITHWMPLPKPPKGECK